MANETDGTHPQVGRVEVIPSAGAVDAAGPIAELVPVKNVNDTSALPSDLSDAAEPSKQEQSNAPERSKGKIALIMSALCVTPSIDACNLENDVNSPLRLPFFLLRSI